MKRVIFRVGCAALFFLLFLSAGAADKEKSVKTKDKAEEPSYSFNFEEKTYVVDPNCGGGNSPYIQMVMNPYSVTKTGESGNVIIYSTHWDCGRLNYIYLPTISARGAYTWEKKDFVTSYYGMSRRGLNDGCPTAYSFCVVKNGQDDNGDKYELCIVGKRIYGFDLLCFRYSSPDNSDKYFSMRTISEIDNPRPWDDFKSQGYNEFKWYVGDTRHRFPVTVLPYKDKGIIVFDTLGNNDNNKIGVSCQVFNLNSQLIRKSVDILDIENLDKDKKNDAIYSHPVIDKDGNVYCAKLNNNTKLELIKWSFNDDKWNNEKTTLIKSTPNQPNGNIILLLDPKINGTLYVVFFPERQTPCIVKSYLGNKGVRTQKVSIMQVDNTAKEEHKSCSLSNEFTAALDDFGCLWIAYHIPGDDKIRIMCCEEKKDEFIGAAKPIKAIDLINMGTDGFTLGSLALLADKEKGINRLFLASNYYCKYDNSWVTDTSRNEKGKDARITLTEILKK